ncbi:D-aminoacyl-tRNA deacylase-like isoform X1 [Branchiostoma floridae x Branchiostoma belcheri]
MIMPNAKGQAKTCTSSSHQDARTALAFIRHAQLSVSSIGRKTLGDELVSSIGRGLCVLIGVSRDDTPKDMEYIVRKILNLRVFDDDQEKRWAHSVKDKNYEILCVSQFTLYSVLKGNKPDFHQSMAAEQSQAFYEEFLQQMRKAYQPDKIKDGRFGAYMQVSIQNDGPVTIQLESPVQQQKSKPEKAKAARQQKWEKKSGASNTAEEPADAKMEQVTEQLSQTST